MTVSFDRNDLDPLPSSAPPATRPRRRRRWTFSLAILAAGLTGLLLFPLYWMLVSAVTPINSLLTVHPQLFPSIDHLELGTFSRVFHEYAVARWLLDSAFVTLGSLILSMAAAVPAGYALSRMRSRGGSAAGLLMLFTRVLPGTLLVIPFFVMFAAVGLLNSLWGLMIADTSIIVPFAAWIMKGFFDSVPHEMEEAAMVDGCGQWSSFVKVVVPLARPGIGATAIYSVILAWSDYLFSRTLLVTPENWTITVGAASLIGDHVIDWNGLMAMGVLAVLPMVVAFVILEPFLVSGMTAGAVVN